MLKIASYAAKPAGISRDLYVMVSLIEKLVLSCADKKKAAVIKNSKRKHPATMKQRYPRRNIATKQYTELELSSDEGEYFCV